MVDVTHDGDDRRTDDQVVLVALVVTELEVERLEQLAVLVLGGDDLDDVVELLAEQLERLVVDRLGRGDHLAEGEQHLHERGRVDVDLLGEVGQRRATRAGGRSRRCPCGRARHRSSGPPWPRTPDDARASTCDHDATGHRGDRRHPGSGHAGRDDRHRDDRHRRGRSHRDDRRGTATGSTGTAGATDDRERHRDRAHRDDRGRHRDRHRDHRGPGRPPGPLPNAAGDLGIIAGLGRGMPDDRAPPSRRPADAADGWSPPEPRRRRARAPAGGPCPGWTRTGCCPDAGRRDGRPGRGAGRLGGRRQRAPRARPAGASGSAAGASGSGRRAGSAPRLGGRAAVSAGSAGAARARQRPRRPSAPRRASAAAGGRLRRLGPGLGAAFLAAASRPRRLGGRCGRSGLQLVAVLLLEPHLDGGLDRRRCRLDELPHLLELLENELALDTELLGEFVDSGLSHASPSGPARAPD